LILYSWVFPYLHSTRLLYFGLLSLIHTSVFYSVLCFTLMLLNSSLSSFTCFCVSSCSYFLVSWNFLSASYSFWLTMSSVFSMNFSVISSKISSLRIFFVSFTLFLGEIFYILWGSGTEYPSSSFPTESCVELFFLRSVIYIPSSFSHPSTWCYVTMSVSGWGCNFAIKTSQVQCQFSCVHI
jgi:hypothetical protein